MLCGAQPENHLATGSEGLGIRERMDEIMIGGELPHSKPHPYPYSEAARRLGVPMERALAFEDSGPGIRSASGAGACTFGLEGAFDAARLIGAGATHVISDFNAPLLWEVLEALTGMPPAQMEAAR